MSFVCFMLTMDLFEKASNEENTDIVEMSSVVTLLLIIYKNFYIFIIYSVGFLFDVYIHFYWYIVIFITLPLLLWIFFYFKKIIEKK